MDTLTIPSMLPELGIRASRSVPVVVATDGRTQSDAALVVGGLLAEKPDALRLLAVLKSMPVIPEAPLMIPPALENARRDVLRCDVINQMARTWDAQYDFDVEEGDPAEVVAMAAHRSGAAMIVCGLGRHRVADRIFGDETALRLMRLSDVPVLAVAGSTRHAPRRIVVAVDFSETSLQASRLAVEIAASGATIYLVHVAPRDSLTFTWKAWSATYKHDADYALQNTREELRIPAGIVCQKVLLQGDSATEILAFAASVNADLIATGSHGHGFVARMLIGSVATRIVRCSTCSVLAVPHGAVMLRE